MIIDLWEVSAFEEVDLSSLRLLANNEAPGTIEIALSDRAFAEEISGSDSLSEPSEFLLCTLVTDNETTDDVEQREEDGDEYDDDEDVSEYTDDGDKLLG